MGNFGYIKNRCGVLKILTIILGALSVGFTAFSCDREWKEETYLGTAIAFLVISLIYLIFHLAVYDAELKSTNKAIDSGYHFLGAIIILCGAILMVYSAVDLRDDIWYFCTYGVGRGIPCILNKRHNNYLPVSSKINFPSPGTGYGAGLPVFNSYYLDTQKPHGGNGYGHGRSFLPPKPLSWLFGQDICFEVLPRILDCNRYFGLKLAGGILGILNAILYGIVGIAVLLSN